MTVLQVAGEFFADGNVRGNAAVKIIKGIFIEKSGKSRCQSLQIVQDG